MVELRLGRVSVRSKLLAGRHNKQLTLLPSPHFQLETRTAMSISFGDGAG